jgi:arylsulfatase A-like enzyme
MEAPPALVEKYRNRENLKDHRYAAMIEELDRQIGRVLAELNELNLADNTLVIFTSDNGAFGGVTDLHPLRGCKGHLYEGGIRVPMFVRWPGRVQSDTACSTPVISMDLFPTILEAAGLETDGNRLLDGKSLVPLLEQTGSLQRDAIYFHYPNYAFHGKNRMGGAIRQGDYKLILWYDDDSVELYNLSEDIGEKKNLSEALPEKAETLKAQLKAWLKRSGAKMPYVK